MMQYRHFMSMLFFELLQIAVGNREEFSYIPSNEEWEELYDLSHKQALTGIGFLAVERLL